MDNNFPDIGLFYENTSEKLIKLIMIKNNHLHEKSTTSNGPLYQYNVTLVYLNVRIRGNGQGIDQLPYLKTKLASLP
jgi:hypothetical protein